MNHVLCVAVWGLAGPAATSSWMSCWTWQSVKEWWISTTVSKPSAPAASTWSRQRSGQVHDNTSHSNQVKYLNTVLHMLKEVGALTSLSLSLLENINRIRKLSICFPLMLFVNEKSEVGVLLYSPSGTYVKVIAIIWEKRLTLSLSVLHRHIQIFICEHICIYSPYYVNATLTCLFITSVLICRGV